MSLGSAPGQAPNLLFALFFFFVRPALCWRLPVYSPAYCLQKREGPAAKQRAFVLPVPCHPNEGPLKSTSGTPYHGRLSSSVIIGVTSDEDGSHVVAGKSLSQSRRALPAPRFHFCGVDVGTAQINNPPPSDSRHPHTFPHCPPTQQRPSLCATAVM